MLIIILIARDVTHHIPHSHLSVLGVHSGSNAVDLLVDLSAVMVSLLTGTGHSEGHAARMPRSDTGDLAQTLVRLAGQLLGVPTAGHTLESLTLGHANAVDHLVLGKDLAHGNGLLQVLAHPLDLIIDGATVQLDLHDVGLLLALLDQADLKWEEGNGMVSSLFKVGLAISLHMVDCDSYGLTLQSWPERLCSVTGI